MHCFCLQNVSSELPRYHFLKQILVEKLFEKYSGERSLFRYFVGRDSFQAMFGRHVSSNILWKRFLLEFVWKILLCKACLVESFPSQIVRWIIFLQIYLGRILPSFAFIFFVEMFLQVPVAEIFIFCGGLFRKLLCTDFSSESFWANMCFPLFLIQVSIEICLARISLEKKLVSTCRRQRCFVQNVFRHFLGRDSSSQSFRWEYLFGDFWYRFFQVFFRSDFSSIFF